MPTCKTCMYWEKGRCDIVNSINTPADDPDTRFDIVIKVSDDDGLQVHLVTGPNFGCVLHMK